MNIRPLFFGVLGVCLCILGFFTSFKFLPYSLDENRRLKGLGLVSAVRSYASVGETNLTPLFKSNAHNRVFPFATNIQLNGVWYHTVIGLEDSNFRRTGFVACTTNAEAVWIDVHGKARVIDFQGRF